MFIQSENRQDVRQGEVKDAADHGEAHPIDKQYGLGHDVLSNQHGVDLDGHVPGHGVGRADRIGHRHQRLKPEKSSGKHGSRPGPLQTNPNLNKHSW